MPNNTIKLNGPALDSLTKDKLAELLRRSLEILGEYIEDDGTALGYGYGCYCDPHKQISEKLAKSGLDKIAEIA
jgi:hypothetical protein